MRVILKEDFVRIPEEDSKWNNESDLVAKPLLCCRGYHQGEIQTSYDQGPKGWDHQVFLTHANWDQSIEDVNQEVKGSLRQNQNVERWI